jgi:DNA invertase Pin-like site-specific DNA recombinase
MFEFVEGQKWGKGTVIGGDTYGAILRAVGDRKDIAKHFGVPLSRVNYIKSGKTPSYMPLGMTHKSKLAILHVTQIREKLAQGAKVNDLAAEYNVARQAISKIKNKKSWQWLDVVN